MARGKLQQGLKQDQASLDLPIGWALSRAVSELTSLGCVADKQSNKHSKIFSQQLYVTSLGNNQHLTLLWEAVIFQTYHRCKSLARQADPMPSKDSGKPSTDFTELRLKPSVSIHENGHPHCCQRLPELPLLPPGWLYVIRSKRIGSLSRLDLTCS